MKQIFLLLLFCTSIFSCAQKQSKNIVLSEIQRDSIKAKKDSVANLQSLNQQLNKYVSELNEEKLDSNSDDCFRIIMNFGWENPYGGFPLSIKFKMNSDTCYVKIAEVIREYDKKGDILNQHLKTRCSFILRDDFYKIKHYIDSTVFWNQLPIVKNNRYGTDSNSYSLEGIINGKYHLVYRWSSDESFDEKLISLFYSTSNYSANWFKDVADWNKKYGSKDLK